MVTRGVASKGAERGISHVHEQELPPLEHKCLITTTRMGIECLLDRRRLYPRIQGERSLVMIAHVVPSHTQTTIPQQHCPRVQRPNGLLGRMRCIERRRLE